MRKAATVLLSKRRISENTNITARLTIKSYSQSLKILKKNFDVYYNRAIAYHLIGDYKKAGLDYCKAIDVAPMNFEGHYNLAVLLRQIDRNKESIAELEKAAILISENPRASEVQTAYIFNLLNEVTRRFITSDEYYTQKLTDEPVGSVNYTYVNGRIVADEDFDKAMYKNFQTCAGLDYFKESDKYEIVAPSSSELNIIDEEKVTSFLQDNYFDIVLNFALYVKLLFSLYFLISFFAPFSQ